MNRGMVFGVAFLTLVAGRWAAEARMDRPPIVQNDDTFDQGTSGSGGSSSGGGGTDPPRPIRAVAANPASAWAWSA